MSVCVLSGFVSGNAPVSAPYGDPRYLGISQSEALERFDEERQGCPLTVKEFPSVQKKRIIKREIGEGLLSQSGSDFRDSIDNGDLPRPMSDGEQISRIGTIDLRELFEGEIQYAFCDGEVIVHKCPEDLVRRLQKVVGFTGIISLGQGFYDLFFPAEHSGLALA